MRPLKLTMDKSELIKLLSVCHTHIRKATVVDNSVITQNKKGAVSQEYTIQPAWDKVWGRETAHMEK